MTRLLLWLLPAPSPRVFEVGRAGGIGRLRTEWVARVEWVPCRVARWLGERTRSQNLVSDTGIVWRDRTTGTRPGTRLETQLENLVWLVRNG